MEAASAMVKEWSRAHGERRLPNRWHFSKTRLSLKTGKYAHFTGKGWHTAVALQWLCSFFESGSDKPEFQRLHASLWLCLWCGNNMMSLVHAARADSNLLSPEDQGQLRFVGDAFLTAYLVLHDAFRGWCGYKLFNPRPKFHMLQHWVDLTQKVRNPVGAATWMDEDWIRSMMTLASKTHIKTTQHSALMRYLAGTASVNQPSLRAGLKVTMDEKKAGLMHGMHWLLHSIHAWHS